MVDVTDWPDGAQAADGVGCENGEEEAPRQETRADDAEATQPL